MQRIKGLRSRQLCGKNMHCSTAALWLLTNRILRLHLLQDDDLMLPRAGIGFVDVGTGSPGTHSQKFSSATFVAWAPIFYGRLTAHMQRASASIGYHHPHHIVINDLCTVHVPQHDRFLSGVEGETMRTIEVHDSNLMNISHSGVGARAAAAELRH